MTLHGRKTAALRLRAELLFAVREFFRENGYLEVETPCRIPAPAPEAHIDAEPSGPWFLQTSPELCMKRLLAAGYDRIYQLCRCFRKGERGSRHLPELTLLEWYTAGVDYTHMMDQTEALIGHVARRLGTVGTLRYRGQAVDLARPFARITVAEAFGRFASLSLEQALETGRFDECMGLEIEPRLGASAPVFLCDYPVSRAALARRKPGDTGLAERFELYVAGLELCNAFSELTDPAEQRGRFRSESAARRSAGLTVYPVPEKFLADLGQMPEAAGNALGIDRLVMLFDDAASIDDVVAFTPEEL